MDRQYADGFVQPGGTSHRPGRTPSDAGSGAPSPSGQRRDTDAPGRTEGVFASGKSGARVRKPAHCLARHNPAGVPQRNLGTKAKTSLPHPLPLLTLLSGSIVGRFGAATQTTPEVIHSALSRAPGLGNVPISPRRSRLSALRRRCLVLCGRVEARVPVTPRWSHKAAADGMLPANTRLRKMRGFTRHP